MSVLKMFAYKLEKGICFSVFQFFISTYLNQQLQAQVIFSAFYTFKNSEISFICYLKAHCDGSVKNFFTRSRLNLRQVENVKRRSD